MEHGIEEKRINILAADKVAKVLYDNPHIDVQILPNREQYAYSVPDTPEVRNSIESYYQNDLVECRRYSDLIKGLRSLLSRTKRQDGR